MTSSSRALPVMQHTEDAERAVVDHAAAAARFNADPDRVTWHDAALWFVREKRDQAVAEVPEWEALRELVRRERGVSCPRARVSLIEG